MAFWLAFVVALSPGNRSAKDASPPIESPAQSTSRGAPMPVPRELHTATLLRDGRVLVAGGAVRDAAVNRVDFYDPKADRWTPGPPLHTARAGHTATMLSDGRVLVLGGGEDSGGEIFDPSQNAWHATRSAGVTLDVFTATLLVDGRVLVVTDEVDEKTPRATATIYDPRRNEWSTAGRLLESRDSHSATRLADGRVLVAGGHKTGTGRRYYEGKAAATEIYDPSTARWTQSAPLAGGLTGHAASLLKDGRVLVTGGWDESFLHLLEASHEAYMFDPARGIWTETIEPGIARVGHIAVALADGRVLVFGGLPSDENRPPSESHEQAVQRARVLLYQPSNGRWTFAGDLGAARTFHTATALSDGSVLIIGGETQGWPFGTPQLWVRERRELARSKHGYSRGRLPPDGALIRYRSPPP